MDRIQVSDCSVTKLTYEIDLFVLTQNPKVIKNQLTQSKHQTQRGTTEVKCKTIH